MADESQETGRTGNGSNELRHINWREVFGFTNIFKSFRLSRHMTKMIIAVLAVVLTWGVGHLLDLIFTSPSNVYVNPGKDYAEMTTSVMSEPDAYWCVSDFKSWRADAAKNVEGRLTKLAETNLVGEKAAYKEPKDAQEAVRNEPGKVRDKLTDYYRSDLEKEITELSKKNDELVAEIKKEKDEANRKKAEADSKDTFQKAVRAANQTYIDRMNELCLLQEQHPFSTFADYESFYFEQALGAALHGDFLTGFQTIRQQKAAARRVAAPGEIAKLNRIQAGELPGGQVEDRLGVLAALSLMGYGILWLASAHWAYAICFFIPLLVIWSVAGGAIARAAALQATREEKAGLGECIRFGVRKMVSFLASPLVPIVVFLVVGFLGTILPNLLGWIPGFGPIWIGIMFGLVLVVSVLLAFLLIGLLAGGLLMAPTVAVEGSDTFDACTRSYQFVLARPWRATLYGVVAAVYGAICYFFVRFLLFLILLVAHWVLSILYFRGGDAVRQGASRWDLMWPTPTFVDFFPGRLLPGGLRDFDKNIMWSGWDWSGSGLVYLWVLLVSAILAAWVISYLFSASTMIYLLLRKAEDATDMKEVYVEEPAEEAAPAAPATQPPAAAGEAAPAAPAPAAAPPPPETPPAGQAPPPAPPAPSETPPGGDPPKT